MIGIELIFQMNRLFAMMQEANKPLDVQALLERADNTKIKDARWQTPEAVAKRRAFLFAYAKVKETGCPHMTAIQECAEWEITKHESRNIASNWANYRKYFNLPDLK